MHHHSHLHGAEVNWSSRKGYLNLIFSWGSQRNELNPASVPLLSAVLTLMKNEKEKPSSWGPWYKCLQWGTVNLFWAIYKLHWISKMLVFKHRRQSPRRGGDCAMHSCFLSEKKLGGSLLSIQLSPDINNKPVSHYTESLITSIIQMLSSTFE